MEKCDKLTREKGNLDMGNITSIFRIMLLFIAEIFFCVHSYAQDVFFQVQSYKCNVANSTTGTALSFFGFNGAVKELKFDLYSRPKNFVGGVSRENVLRLYYYGEVEFYETNNCMHRGLWRCSSSLKFKDGIINAELNGSDDKKYISGLDSASYKINFNEKTLVINYHFVEQQRVFPFNHFSPIVNSGNGYCMRI